MYYRVHEIKLKINSQKSEIPDLILKRLGSQGRGISLSQWNIVKESIDARDKGDILFVYTVDFEISPERELDLGSIKNVEKVIMPEPEELILGTEELSYPPVIAGFGPCGMFAALILAEKGYRPVVLERGRTMDQRTADVEKFWAGGELDEESNVQFGEGGAGTFSDGKLTTGIKDKRAKKVLEVLAFNGGGEELLYKQKPHVGTDVLKEVVVAIRNRIIELGGTICFESKITDIITDGGRLSSISVNGGKPIRVEQLILAIGHSARDTLKKLMEIGLNMEQKPFSMGLRIEHPQTLINKAQYGNESGMGLGAADYKLSYRCGNGRGVYTFCMCPGGRVIAASSEKGKLVSNGMSERARDSGLANSGLLVDVRTSDFPSVSPLAGIELQEKYEKLAYEAAGKTYELPFCSYDEFKMNRGKGQAIRDCLPDFASEAILEAMPYMGRKLRGFDHGSAKLYAVETRSSSPVRLLRDSTFQSNLEGIYPGGEGAGYAGGIVSAAVDGIRIAEQILSKYKTPIGNIDLEGIKHVG